MIEGQKPLHNATNSQAREEFKIINKLGLHARAAAKLVHLASQFDAHIVLKRMTKGREVEANAKSIMSVMMLAASKGVILAVEAEGHDATNSIKALGELINDRFGETE